MTTGLAGLAAWLETVRLHGIMQSVDWLVPTVQTIHILAVAATFSSSLVLTLRIHRLAGTDWSPAQWGQRLNGWVGWGLVVLLLSGILMIVGEPARSLLSSVFQAKMILLVVTLALLVWLVRQVRHIDARSPIPSRVRLIALLSLLLWLAIIACGRWIAYS